VPAKKTASASSKKPAAKSKASKPTRGGAKPARKAASKAPSPGRKTANAKTGVKPNVKKATKAAAKKASPSSATKVKTSKGQATKKAASKKPAAATKRPVVKTARPKAASPAPARAAATAKPATAKSAAAEPAAKKAPRLAPHRHVVETTHVAAGELQGLRAKLLAEREAVTRLYENDMRMSLLPDEDVTDDLVDRANNAYSRELHFAISDNERERLGLIDQALERMNQGTFGTCLACKRPVPTPRLQAVPWARYCTDCQELAEKGLLREP
jgi:DnaK suppressor protein